jgi:putative flippase GtrA
MVSMRRLLAQFSQFGVVGLVGFGVDVVLFNVLRATVLEPSHVLHGSFYSSVISTSAAIVVNWLGNRFWTFRNDRKGHWLREAVEFGVVSLGGLGISLACLWVSRYGLHLESVLADNVSKNVVGLALGTVFRFTFYRLWVFRGRKPEGADAPLGEEDAPVSAGRHEAADEARATARHGAIDEGRASARPSAPSRPVARTAPAGDAPRRD